ncbi:MAG: hypothetical protein M3461_02830 [Pseudomonadota bacterium]|nr:hypothetical protein [Pseudomonadota bacterium]
MGIGLVLLAHTDGIHDDEAILDAGRRADDAGCAIHSARVSGRKKLKTCRLRGVGSRPLVK